MGGVLFVLDENTEDEIKFWRETDEQNGHGAPESGGLESYGEAATCWAVAESSWNGEEVNKPPGLFGFGA